MKKNVIAFLISMVTLFVPALAQVADTSAPVKKQKIALFAPLYLDSAFNEADYSFKYGKSFPKFLMPGLEFYEGAQFALDSLNKEGAHLEVVIFDTKSTKRPLSQMLQGMEMNGVELMIGSANAGETKLLADYALRKKIPYISSLLPQDAGVADNPYFVIVNSTLKTHCEGLYKYLQKNYPATRVVLFRKKGALEDRIKSWFSDMEKNTPGAALKIQYVDIDSTLNTGIVAPYLDTVRTVCISGTMDVTFGKKLAASLAPLTKKRPVTLIGMPTWDEIGEFGKSDYKGLEVIYSSPYNFSRSERQTASVVNKFNARFMARPSDMVLKGYEVMMRFARLLLEYKEGITGNLGVKKYKIFNDFDIQPVLSFKNGNALQYFENRKLYFVKRVNGTIVGVY
jgi:Periplasmic binding protein